MPVLWSICVIKKCDTLEIGKCALASFVRLGGYEPWLEDHWKDSSQRQITPISKRRRDSIHILRSSNLVEMQLMSKINWRAVYNKYLRQLD